MSTDRRRFLLRSAGTLGAGAFLGAGTAQAAGSGRTGDDPPTAAATDAGLGVRRPFDGRHQSGVLLPQADAVAHLALDAIAPDGRGSSRACAP